MKTYTITVNGKIYEVTVEEKAGNAAAPAPVPAQPAAAAAAPAPAAPAEKPAQAAGNGAPVKTGAAGKVFQVVKQPGDAVKKGDAVIIVESMKMEIPLVSPQDGKVAQILCNVGDAVEADQVLATIE